jgi:hypothetical protein
MLYSRQDLADYALRTLGAPVINIEVADEQLADAVETGLMFFQDYHPDGTIRDYVKHQVTAEDVENRWIPIDEDIHGVMRVIPWAMSFADGMFDITYQLRMNDLRNLSSGSMSYFTMTLEYLELLDFLLRKEKQFRFNRRMNRLFLDINWKSDVKVGEFIVVECYRAINDDTYTEVFNDPWLKKYVSALVKKYWGSNLRKYTGVSLPGGVTLDGERIYAEAKQEIFDLETDLINNQAPCNWFMG